MPAVVSKRGLMMGIIGRNSLQPARESYINYKKSVIVVKKYK